MNELTMEAPEWGVNDTLYDEKQEITLQRNKNEIALISDELLPMELEKRLDRYTETVVIVRKFVKANLREDEHYGTFPGIKGKILFKAGAEALCNLFHAVLEPEIQDKIINPESGYIYYEILTSVKRNGILLGSGFGSCCSLENNYRYRWIKADKPDDKTVEDMKEKGIGRNRKVWNYKEKREEWQWQKRTENHNLIDLNNTILKMAEKRSTINAVIKAFGISIDFTQDIETDRNSESIVNTIIENKPIKKTNAKQKTPTKKDNSNGKGSKINELYDQLKGFNNKNISILLKDRFEVNFYSDLTLDQIEYLITNIAEIKEVLNNMETGG